MADQLTSPEFLGIDSAATRRTGCLISGFIFLQPALVLPLPWPNHHYWQSPSKPNRFRAVAINAWGLRMAVSIGVAFGLALGTFRIVTGIELYWYIAVSYLIVMIQTLFAPKIIIGLAYDSGGVTTSTVTVPLVTALGLGLASHVPGRNPLLDGFGLIAFACLFPIIAVLGYAKLAEWRARQQSFNNEIESEDFPCILS